MRRGSRHHDPLLADDVALNDPVAPVPVHVKTPVYTKGRMVGVRRVVATERVPWDIRAFQFRRPFVAAGRDARVHRL